jgi:phosphoglycolate phosphatase-like HAD superfamily hydrolase
LLLLFDIDGTLLIGAHAPHREALHQALREVYGIADPAAPAVAAAGRTDTAIAREIAERSRVRDFDRLLPKFVAACVAEFRRRCPPTLADLLAPGIGDLLDGLAAFPNVRASLVTGNYEPIARLKLERAGIADHFAPAQGAFGSDAELRAELPAIARLRAGLPGPAYPREQTLVIGDTPLDVAAAHADGVAAIAVASGPYAASQLGDADYVVRDADALAQLLENELLTGRAGRSADL